MSDQQPTTTEQPCVVEPQGQNWDGPTLDVCFGATVAMDNPGKGYAWKEGEEAMRNTIYTFLSTNNVTVVKPLSLYNTYMGSLLQGPDGDTEAKNLPGAVTILRCILADTPGVQDVIHACIAKTGVPGLKIKGSKGDPIPSFIAVDYTEKVESGITTRTVDDYAKLESAPRVRHPNRPGGVGGGNKSAGPNMFMSKFAKKH